MLIIFTAILSIGTVSETAGEQHWFDFKNCEEKFAMWELLGKEEFKKMFARDQETLQCIPYYEQGNLPKEVIGKYTNSDAGLEIVFPKDWSGVESSFEGKTSVYMISDDFERIHKDDSNTFIMILSIVDVSAATDIPKAISQAVKRSNDIWTNTIAIQFCTTNPSRIVNINDMDSYMISIECDEPIYTPSDTITVISYVFMTEEKMISLTAVWLHSQWTMVNTSEIDDTIRTIQIENVIDLEEIETSDKHSAKTQIPQWIKQNAEWWANGSIGDRDFASGIQYLIKEKIMQIPESVKTSVMGEQEVENRDETERGWIQVNGKEYVLSGNDSVIVTVTGQYVNFDWKFYKHFQLTHPNGDTEEFKAPHTDGDFNFEIPLTPNSKLGEYTIEGMDTGYDIGSVKFTLNSEKEIVVGTVEEIPSWVKNNADWWAQGLISDDDFVKGIQHLVEQGIIIV